MRMRVILLLLLSFLIRSSEASQGLWQGGITYDVMVWHGYQLSGIQLEVANKVSYDVVSRGNNRVVAKGWKCFFETKEDGIRKVQPVELNDLKLEHVCGTETDWNVWLDALFLGYRNSGPLLSTGVLPLELYPSNLLPAIDRIQERIKNEREVSENKNLSVKTFLPWPLMGDNKTSSPEVRFDSNLLISALNCKCQRDETNEYNNIVNKDQLPPSEIELLNPNSSKKPLDYYAIYNVQEWKISKEIVLGEVELRRKNKSLRCKLKVKNYKIAICDKHKEVRRLYVEFELSSPDLFTIVAPNPNLKPNPDLKVKRSDGENSLIFFVGVQVQPRVSDICLDDEWLEEEEE